MKENTNTNWFEDRELPKIDNDIDLLLAFSIVKAHLNGSPNHYTRNDYLLFVNTVYAAIKSLQSKLNNLDTTLQNTASAVLSEDLITNYTPEVGYVESGTEYTKDTLLEEIIKDMLVGIREKLTLTPPTIHGDNFEDSKTISITSDVSKDVYLIYYTTDEHPGWRIYDEEFTITKDTTIKAKLVPKYDYYRFYDESDISTANYYKYTQLKSPQITCEDNPFINEGTITITHANDEISCKIYYTTDNEDTPKLYTEPFIIDKPTYITAWIDDEIKSKTRFKSKEDQKENKFEELPISDIDKSLPASPEDIYKLYDQLKSFQNLLDYMLNRFEKLK